jgi:hypothetical protein
LTVVPARSAFAGQTDTFGTAPQPPRLSGVPRQAFAVSLGRPGLYRDSIRIYNRTAAMLPLYVYAADASVNDAGVVVIGFRSSRTVGLGSWVHVSRTVVLLPPHGQTTVPFFISVRSPVPHHPLAAIVVEESTSASGSGFDVVQRVATLIRPAGPGSPPSAPRVGEPRTRWIWPAAASVTLAVLIAVVERRRRSSDGRRPLVAAHR